MSRFIFILFLITIFQVSTAQTTEPNGYKYCLFDGDIGLGGYDPIGYFDENMAIEGDIDITAEYEGVIYQFSTEANKEKFIKSPDKYLPQFGGWCSMTLAMGQATRPKYDNFIIENNKLYLFERTLSVNGQEVWKQNPKEHEKSAIKNYKKFSTTGKLN